MQRINSHAAQRFDETRATDAFGATTDILKDRLRAPSVIKQFTPFCRTRYGERIKFCGALGDHNRVRGKDLVITTCVGAACYLEQFRIVSPTTSARAPGEKTAFHCGRIIIGPCSGNTRRGDAPPTDRASR